MRVFVSGGTGYIGQRLIRLLLERGHAVSAVTRAESVNKLPRGATAVIGDALDAATFSDRVGAADAFVHLVGVSHPAPWKEREFVAVDLASVEASVAAARQVKHFVYVSVAQPAPVMQAYIRVRAECEALIAASGLNATFIRPWYVLGPGHRWPVVLIPFYRLFEKIPATRDTATRLGLVTIQEMIRALAWAVENPAPGRRVIAVPEIRSASARLDASGSAAGPATASR